MNKNPKIIAYYYPQFHEILENNQWWGEGFTDWVNVQKSKPLFPGHYQPRIPLGGNYYDLADEKVIKKQADLAEQYGIYGFCFYHYWFDGKLLLEKPLELYLKSNEIKLPFCLCWANETWSKRWIGKDQVILQKQTHLENKELWEKHFYYLLKFFKDDRAIRINGKPIFLIYNPEIINSAGEMFGCWNELALKNGLPGIYFIATRSFDFVNPNVVDNFNAVVNFQPREVYNSSRLKKKNFLSHPIFQKMRFLPEGIMNYLTAVRYRVSNYEVINYDDAWKQIIEGAKINLQKGNKQIFPGAFVDWDNTPRYGSKAKIFHGANPDKFEQWMKELCRIVEESEEPFIFLNAWNEWAESAYLEPDERYGNQYLEAIKNVVKK